jgi:RNA polymerase sigma-70 factor (ECF subfamily)
MTSLNGTLASGDNALALVLESAQGKTAIALAEAVAACRQYLLLIANQELDPALIAKAGASDLVQETLLTAEREFHAFRGATQGELLRWLRQILLNHLVETRRRYLQTQKRAAGRELSLDGLFRSAAEGVAADASTPSRRLMRRETEEMVQAAVERLPERYRAVIELRYWEKLPFEEVAQRMEISSDAARQLWRRAIERLRRELKGKLGV